MWFYSILGGSTKGIGIWGVLMKADVDISYRCQNLLGW
jgi:hypothetical protein